MPIYEYSCEDCLQIFEEWQKDFQGKEKTCPVCGGTAHRLISNTSFVLKGSGWYSSGYSKESGDNGQKKNSTPTTADSSSNEASSEISTPTAS